MSPALTNSIATHLESAVKPMMETIVRNTFTQSLLPGLQQAVLVMFKQVHDTLDKGLQEGIHPLHLLL